MGYTAAAVSAPTTSNPGPATAVSASNPSYPLDPPLNVLPDPDVPPPLAPPFSTRPVSLGQAPFAVTFPVPATWQRFDTNAGEARFTPPGNPSHTYSIRVELVGSQTRTIQQSVTDRVTDLQGDTRIEDLQILAQADDSLIASFVLDDFRIVSVLRWVSPRGTPAAEVEISASGRMRDRPGLEALAELVARRIRP